MSNNITDKWQEIKTLIESIDLDVHKNAAGNVSAGVRARKGLRLLKNQAAELVKTTVENDKVRKSEK
jgi:hypothetical protein